MQILKIVEQTMPSIKDVSSTVSCLSCRYFENGFSWCVVKAKLLSDCQKYRHLASAKAKTTI